MDTNRKANTLPSDPALAAVLDSVECGVLLFGAEGELRAANDRLAQMLHFEPARLRELENFETLVTHLAPQFAGWEALAERWRQRFQSDEASWDALELQRPVRKVVERFARPVFGGQGQRLGWLEIYRDATLQRLVETKKLFHTDRMTMLGQLVSSIAHELNNPLTSILGYAQLLCRDGAAGNGKDNENKAQRILEQAARASRIAKNLLLFARQADPGRTRVNLNEIVERTLALRSYDLRLENIQVESDLDPNLPLVLADATQIQQVLLNLLLNAEQALRLAGGKVGGPPRRIQLRTRRVSSQRVAIRVDDNGPGIAPEVLPRIFDAFFTTKPPGMGTGLGLSIVYGIVQEHGGEVSVESRQGHGATFQVLLPAALPVESIFTRRLHAPKAALPDEKLLTANERRGARILVVEDEPTVAQLIADVLGEEGHAVDVALDSRESLALIGRKAYDLMICDLRMPHMDGRAIYRELLRQDSPLARRLIFVTGDIMSPRTVEFLEKCQVPYLAKPFLVEELKEALHSALVAADRKAPSDAPRESIPWRRSVSKKR